MKTKSLVILQEASEFCGLSPGLTQVASVRDPNAAKMGCLYMLRKHHMRSPPSEMSNGRYTALSVGNPPVCQECFQHIDTHRTLLSPVTGRV